MKIDKMNILFIPLGIIIAFMSGVYKSRWWGFILLLLGYFIIRVPYELDKYKD